MDNFVAIDFEPANANRSSICSVGIVIVKNGEVVDRFYQLIRPIPNFYTYWNTRVHGLTDYDTAMAPRFPEVWSSIAPKLQGLPLVAHNSAFDESCLKKAFEAYQLIYPNYIFYCTLKASRKSLPRLINHQLGTVASCCGYSLQNHHNALADAEACAAIAIKILK